MELFGQWEDLPMDARASRAPLPHEEFDNYFEAYNEIDNLFNETLTGLQDLDVPSGFMNNNTRKTHQAKHSRQLSGTAIFGFAEHTRELSLGGGILGDLHRPKPSTDLSKYISPGEILNLHQRAGESLPNLAKPIHLAEQDEIEFENQNQKELEKNKEKLDYLVTNNNPKSYKFPPSPPADTQAPVCSSTPSINRFSAKYLQEINSKDDGSKQQYVDDIEPLLYEANFEDPSPSENASPSYQYNHRSLRSPEPVYKYVPIPAQQPQGAIFTPQQIALNKNQNSILPPPSPPTLSNGSPDWQSSPEPQSPSPSRSYMAPGGNSLFSSPVHQQLGPQRQLYQPQFFSDNDLLYQEDKQNYSSPYANQVAHAFNSSPLRNNMTNNMSNNMTPTRHMAANDDTIDANVTISQLTPLKSQFPMTPRKKDRVGLEWSPVISPHPRVNTTQGVRDAIQQSSPKKRVAKTSLLPPGELDQYWVGPDEDKQFTCTYQDCGKKFTRRYNVRSHIQTHLSDRPFACAYCPKKFVRQHDLNRHVKAHLENRHCKCPCGKVFSRLDAMRKHQARNICSGGVYSDDNHHILKPKIHGRPEVLDVLTSDRLTEEINSALKQDYA